MECKDTFTVTCCTESRINKESSFFWPEQVIGRELCALVSPTQPVSGLGGAHKAAMDQDWMDKRFVGLSSTIRQRD